MKIKRNTQYILFIILLSVDQLTKWLAGRYLGYLQPYRIIDGFFYLTYTQNSGGAWSILAGQYGFFVVAGIVVSCFLIYWYFSATRPMSSWALTLMIAGALGNLIDRLYIKEVRDFLDFYVFGYDFPIFNLADSCLCIGVGLLLLDMILEEQDARRQNIS